GSPGIKDSGKSEVTSCKHEFHFQCILEWYCSLAFSVNCLKVLTGRASHEVLLRIAHAVVSTSLEPEQVVDDEEMAHHVVDVDKAANSLAAGVHSDNVDVDSDIGELIPLHDLVATPNLVNKVDVESMGRNGYENPSLPTVLETHYIETASYRRKSSTPEFCLISGDTFLPHPSKHWWSSSYLSLVATTSSSKLGRESFIDLNLLAPAEQDDANQFEDSTISNAEFVNSVK
ncbi:hypothetical protein HN51_054924, partial [Arachis hypogaea]